MTAIFAIIGAFLVAVLMVLPGSQGSAARRRRQLRSQQDQPEQLPEPLRRPPRPRY